MNRKQTIIAFIAFFVMLAVITMPLWLERVSPYLNSCFQSVMDTAERWVEALKKYFNRF